MSEPSEPTCPIFCKTELEPPSVEYDQSLTDTTVVKSGDSIKFSIRIYGKPTPRVRWTKDGDELDTRIKIDNGPASTTVIMPDCTRHDSGKFLLITCDGSNKYFYW